jgi:hypothetical protein
MDITWQRDTDVSHPSHGTNLLYYNVLRYVTRVGEVKIFNGIGSKGDGSG